MTKIFNILLYCRCNGTTHVNVGSTCEELERSAICRNSGGIWEGTMCNCEGDQFQSWMTNYGACVKK